MVTPTFRGTSCQHERIEARNILSHEPAKLQRRHALFVTYPFTFVNDPMKSEYLAEVVRVEQLSDGRFGIAIRLLMTI
jgi:hypothetical protein